MGQLESRVHHAFIFWEFVHRFPANPEPLSILFIPKHHYRIVIIIGREVLIKV